jgi:flagellin-like hook-associated protein FlgL
MKKTQLKQVLKPLIKECIKEVIFEEGVLSNIVSEVAQGMRGSTIVESQSKNAPSMKRNDNRAREEQQQQIKEKMRETRKKMLDAIGQDSYNGVDLFEGTTPTPSPAKTQQGDPLGGVDPNDSGVDISSMFGGTSHNWAQLIK